MNRPEVLNALSKGMFQDLTEALDKASRSTQVRFVAITGAGKAFSAGLDVKEVDSLRSKGRARNFVYNIVKPFWKKYLECDKPVLAVVDGPAYGAGAEIALISDIVIASTRSKFAFSGGRVGALCCISGVIGPSLMNGRKLVEMNLSGSPLSAKEAQTMGLVSYAVPGHALSGKTDEVIQSLRRVSSLSNSSFKRIRAATIQKNVLETAYHELFKTITSRDFQKGAVAFISKSSPEY